MTAASRSNRQAAGSPTGMIPSYFVGSSERRTGWRTLGLGVVLAALRRGLPGCAARTRLAVAAVPWARCDIGHARAFVDQVTRLVVQCSKPAVTQLMPGAPHSRDGRLTGLGTQQQPALPRARNRPDLSRGEVVRSSALGITIEALISCGNSAKASPTCVFVQVSPSRCRCALRASHTSARSPVAARSRSLICENRRSR